MTEQICEIGASSWFYYREISLHVSISTLHLPAIFSSHTIPVRMWYRPSTCLRYSFHTRLWYWLVVEGRIFICTRCTGCRISDLAARV